MKRWFRFFLAILVGAGLGLFYAWVINPVEYVNTSPNTLRVDYKTDYVLMVAEAFHEDGDLNLAVQRLASLGETPPQELVSQAVTFAQKVGYTDTDVALLQALLKALPGNPSAHLTGAP
jgi:hypothetical protein